MQHPNYLTKGSKIALVAPARKISRDEIAFAVRWIEEKGFEAIYDDRLFAEYHQLAGDDDFRAKVLQDYLDRDDIDAILCVRGGYGTIRIVDKLDFTKFAKHPKWIVGYSDVTVLHAKMQQLGYQSIHGTMPINFEKNTKEALESLYEALTNPSFRLERSGMEKSHSIAGDFSTSLEMTGWSTPRTTILAPPVCYLENLSALYRECFDNQAVASWHEAL